MPPLPACLLARPTATSRNSSANSASSVELRADFIDLRADFIDLRTHVDQGFAAVDQGFSEMRGKLDGAAAGQHAIVELLQVLIADQDE